VVGARPGFVCELTPACNLRCGFCYNVWLAPGAPKAPSSAVLDFEGWVRVLEHLPMDGGVEWLCFAGGEPLLSDTLLPLAQYVRKAHPGVRLGVASNGTLLTEARLRELSATIDYLELSLLSLDPTRYLALTGADLLAHAKSAITLAAVAPIPTTVALTLVPMPAADLCSMLDFALAFGARKIVLNRFAASGRGAARESEFRLSLEALRGLLEVANTFCAKRGVHVDVTLPVEDCLLAHADFEHLRFHPCVCAKLKWTVGPNGQLRTCEQSAVELGDLRTSTFEQLRAHAAVDAFRAQNFCSQCPDCSKWEQCGGGCRFVRHAFTG
jgi:radical SAM protein with 4Fe4S-binding SPASM domain